MLYLTAIALALAAVGFACSGENEGSHAVPAVDVPGSPVLCPEPKTGPAFASFPRNVSAARIMYKTVDAMRQVGSAHVDMAVRLELDPLPVSITLVGDYQAPNCTSLTVSGFPVSETEVIGFGNVTYRRPMGDGWTYTLEGPRFFFDPVTIMEAVQSDVTDLRLSGRQTLDGRTTFYLEGTLPGQALGEAGDAFDVEMWIALRDSRFRQVILRGVVDLGDRPDPMLSGLDDGEVSVLVIVKLWDYGKEVSVEPPLPGLAGQQGLP